LSGHEGSIAGIHFPGNESDPIRLSSLTDFIAILILSKDVMRCNITKGNDSQFYKAWSPLPLMDVDHIGTQGLPQLEYWNNGMMGRPHGIVEKWAYGYHKGGIFRDLGRGF